MSETTETRYPEHEKLRAVKDESQAIGTFLDFGLAAQGLSLYQRITRPCECQWCERGRGHRSPWHTDAEKDAIVDGAVQVVEHVPTSKAIQAILADYFNIDRDRIDAEKDAMLDQIREANAST